MKKSIYKILVATALVFLVQSCFHQVSRVDPDKEIDLSGKWNDVDSKLTAEAMVEQILGDIWLANFVKKEGKKPVVIVGLLRTKVTSI